VRPAEGTLTADERSMAMLAHLLTIFATFFAPLAIYFAKRHESRFVAFHALQALLWQGVVVASFFPPIFVFMFMTGIGIPESSPAARNSLAPPSEVVFAVLVAWGLLMLLGLVNLACTVYMAARAHSGHWSRYPGVGALVERYSSGDTRNHRRNAR
jgi:uncharacterized Tic20 family protein